jgi:Protein of unknown function (DUF3990)
MAQYSLAHGTVLPGFAVTLGRCRPNTDFGQGFYLTTSEQQARDWANTRARQTRRKRMGGMPHTLAVLLSFDVSRDALASLEMLAFVRATDDYHDFVDHCRTWAAGPRHGRAGPSDLYDVVVGPVRLWPQRLVIFDADQISFNTPAAVGILPPPVVLDIAAAQTGLF